MEQDLWIYVGWLAAAGIASGYAGGLFGIGGGILRVPIFLYLFPAFGIAPSLVMHMAVATSLALALPSSISASLMQWRAGNVDVPFLKLWLPALAVGVVIGVVASRFIEGESLQAAFAIVILIAAIHMLVSSDSFKLADRLAGWLRTFFAAFFGAASTLLGLTGGTFITPILNAFDYPIHRAIAVSSVGGVLISTVAATGYIINGLDVSDLPDHAIGYVDGIAFLVMAPIVMAAAPFGVRLGNRLNKHALKRIFGTFLVVVALDMLNGVWHVV
ncbi:MAG: sulfite exporter TauE/SafE family protein [Pseudomonadota bacterium]